MLSRQVALVTDTKQVSAAELSNVSAALQKQVTRDFAPIWEVQASVDSFPSLQDVPLGYWPIVVMEDIKTDGAAGIHQDKEGQPIALVQLSDGWSLTASHECLEMLADPFGNRLMVGQSPIAEQGRVEFLVEVCDPSEAPENGYSVNNLLVSDFYTPEYFNPVENAELRYSFTGRITKPRQVLQGGYLSWHELEKDHWWQAIWFDTPNFTFRDIGLLERTVHDNLRSMIYGVNPKERLRLVDSARRYFKERNLGAALTSAAARSKNKADAWRRRIGEILSSS
jgi:hypothetical protein